MLIVHLAKYKLASKALKYGPCWIID